MNELATKLVVTTAASFAVSILVLAPLHTSTEERALAAVEATIRMHPLYATYDDEEAEVFVQDLLDQLDRANTHPFLRWTL